MLKEKSKILVRDILTKQILFQTSLEESESAYQFAAQMEELGLDIEVISPTLSETLTTSLGVSEEKMQQYKESMEDEIEAHEVPCCNKID